MQAEVNGMKESSKAPAAATDLATMPKLSIETKSIELDMDEIKKWVAPQGATAKEIYTFGRICQTLGLNPFKKEIHFIKYGSVDASIFVGYTVYIDRGERSGKLNGWHVEMDDPIDPTTATITIHRKDWTEPFKWTVYRKEVEKLKKDGTAQSTWASQPRFQLMKCAIAQGFRLAFPSECGELPYTAEEIAPNNGYLPQVPELSEATVEGASSLGPNDDIEHLHNQYHKRARQLFENDDFRHAWQEEVIGKKSTNDWEVVDYQKAISLLDDEIAKQQSQNVEPESEAEAKIDDEDETQEEPEQSSEPPPATQDPPEQDEDDGFRDMFDQVCNTLGVGPGNMALFMNEDFTTPAQAKAQVAMALRDDDKMEVLEKKYSEWAKGKGISDEPETLDENPMQDLPPAQDDLPM
jgi:phage recombination protein Bet